MFTQGAGPGTVIFLTGMTSSCTRGDGVAYPADPITGIALPRGWQTLTESPSIDLATYGFAGQALRAQVQVGAGGNVNALTLCYHRSGRVWSSLTAGGGPGWQDAPIMMRIDRLVGGAVRGTERQLLFPQSGNPRLR